MKALNAVVFYLHLRAYVIGPDFSLFSLLIGGDARPVHSLFSMHEGGVHVGDGGHKPRPNDNRATPS